MRLLWNPYVFRREAGVADLWDRMFANRKAKLLYIAGRGFDVRGSEVLRGFLESCHAGKYQLESADLLLVGFDRYELSEELIALTKANELELRHLFSGYGEVNAVTIGKVSEDGDEDLSATGALFSGNQAVVAHLKDHTDIILDVSSLPRVVYLSLITAMLGKLIPDKSVEDALYANGVNFQVLVAENALLDAAIRSEDPSDELVLIPGFGSALRAESMRDWPLVWFPMLGENRESQFDKVATLASIPSTAEVCPILPHPSKNPRRADDLLISYRQQLFDAQRQTPTSNILYAHESNPFEAYRQLYQAMSRYCKSLSVLGGCRMLVTPLSSKLMTVAAGLACFEMKPEAGEETYAVAIPYAEPKRYAVSIDELKATPSTLSCMVLTGESYRSF